MLVSTRLKCFSVSNVQFIRFLFAFANPVFLPTQRDYLNSDFCAIIEWFQLLTSRFHLWLFNKATMLMNWAKTNALPELWEIGNFDQEVQSDTIYTISLHRQLSQLGSYNVQLPNEESFLIYSFCSQLVEFSPTAKSALTQKTAPVNVNHLGTPDDRRRGGGGGLWTIYRHWQKREARAPSFAFSSCCSSMDWRGLLNAKIKSATFSTRIFWMHQHTPVLRQLSLPPGSVHTSFMQVVGPQPN